MKEQGIKCVLTPEQAQKMETSFLEMDTDNDGHVSRDELQKLLHEIGVDVTDKIVDDIMHVADENRDGKIQFQEFKKAASRKFFDELMHKLFSIQEMQKYDADNTPPLSICSTTPATRVGSLSRRRACRTLISCI